MSSETHNPGRRRSRRSGKYSPGGGRPVRSRQSEKKPEPQTFWQKIISFFKGESPTQPAKSGPRSEKRETRVERPAAREHTGSPERPQRERKPRGTIRKPESVEVTTPRIYVGNLSFDASESDLFELFNGVGLVQNVEIVCNKATQRSKGFAFVQMQTIEEARRAVEELHDKEYMGRKLVVSGAKADDRRPERESSSEPEVTTEENAEPADEESVEEGIDPEGRSA
jgi:RNA recognition motif-containing protein